MLILQQDYPVARNGTRYNLVVALDIRPARPVLPGIERPRRVSLILTKIIERREDPAHHVIQPRQRHLAGDGVGKLVRPQKLLLPAEVVPRHRHVHARPRAPHRRVLRVPVADHVPFELELLLQHPVEQPPALARPRRVELVVRAHDAGDVGFHGVGKGPQVQLVHGAVVDV
jgi:hypothetical protein